MKLSAKQINEIAQDLEAGMKVFINRKNLEIRTILDWNDMLSPEPWIEELEKIQSEWEAYVVIEKLKSVEAFKIMESFIDEIDNMRLQEDLLKILNRKSPFANFKAEIESSAYRQEWFKFRIKKYEEYVKDQLDIENIDFEV